MHNRLQHKNSFFLQNPVLLFAGAAPAGFGRPDAQGHLWVNRGRPAISGGLFE